jgi:imidazolonepropionase-like amidohydrolase
MKRRICLLLAAFCLLPSAFAAEKAVAKKQVATDQPLVLRGATVHTVSGKDLPNTSVLIKNGKIEALGQTLRVAGAREIDVRGLHVYPGLINAATTIGLTEISAVRETSDTSDLGDYNPQLRAYSAINPASEHIPVARANGITTVLSSPSGGVISGQAALINLAGWTIDEMAVRKSVGMVIRFPSPTQRLGRGGGMELLMMMLERPGGAGFTEARRTYERRVAELREWLDKARHYAQARAAETPDVKRDLKLEALVPLVKGEQPALMTVSTARDIRNALEFADKEKIKVVLIDPDDAWKETELLKKKDIPVILGPTLSLPRNEDDPYDLPYSQPAMLHKAGVKFAISTGGVQFARNLPYQAAQAAAFGLPKDEALKAITLYPAQIFGAKELGSIEPGKTANLIVTDGDPLESRTQVKRLIIAGREVSTDNKHKQLYEKYIARP